MFSLEDVRSMVKGLDEITGLNGADLVFKQINSQKTLGAFIHGRTYNKITKETIKRVPVRFEFSKLILSCNRETLEEVVKHEYAHYMALVTYNDNCGHDWRFKEMCKRINANANEPTFTNDNLHKQTIKMAKYVVECQGCGHQFTYQRKCSTLTACQNGTARCTCGCTEFKVTQNH